MKYVRIISTGTASKWVERNPPIDSVADLTFGSSKAANNPSLYRAFTEIEEVRVTSAHLLAGLDSLEAKCVLRLDDSDIQASGLRVDEAHLGKTGIISIDFAHCEIPWKRDKVRALVARIVDRLRRGEDRIRRIGPLQLEHQLKSFHGLPPAELTPYGKRRCCELLKTSVEEIQEALDSKVCIPRDIISMHAYLISLTPDRYGVDAVCHWLDSEDQLRSMYVSHYMKFAEGRTRN